MEAFHFSPLQLGQQLVVFPLGSGIDEGLRFARRLFEDLAHIVRQRRPLLRAHGGIGRCIDMAGEREVFLHLLELGAVDLRPVIVITAMEGMIPRFHALDSGATDYVTKPFSPRDLLQRAEKSLKLKSRREPHRCRMKRQEIPA